MKKILEFIKASKPRAVILAVVLAFCVWDIVDQPMFWQVWAVENKIAIKKYADHYYPRAKIIGYDFDSTKLFYTSLGHDTVIYRYNDVEFAVFARDGKVHGDSYERKKTEKEFADKYLNPFFEKHNISPKYFQFINSGLSEEDYAEYEGYSINIITENLPIDFTPHERDWYYDFYLYWQEACPFPSYEVSLLYQKKKLGTRAYRLEFDEDTVFSSPQEFYAAFACD